MSAQHRLADLAVSANGFVFDPVTGASFSVNPVGLVLLEGLRQGLDKTGLITLLERRFALPERGADLHRDVEDFVEQLRNNDIVSQDFAF
jgi:hypothetical protein